MKSTHLLNPIASSILIIVDLFSKLPFSSAGSSISEASPTCTTRISTTLSPVPTTSEPTAAPTTSEPSAAPTRELTAAPTIWTCPEDVLVPIGTWDDDYWWRELPSYVQDAAAVYGYDENSWDDGDDLCPDFCEEWWKDLTDEQKCVWLR